MATEKNQVLESTKDDAADMSRLGQGQELKRTFKRVSTLGFALINVLTWPSVIGLAVYSLINGGLAVCQRQSGSRTWLITILGNNMVVCLRLAFDVSRGRIIGRYGFHGTIEV